MGWPGHRLALLLGASVLVAWLGVMMAIAHEARLDPSASGSVLAVFEPGTEADAAFAAIVEAGGKPVRATWLPFVWVTASDEPGFVGRLTGQGAIAVYGEMPFAPSLAGCLAYADSKVAELFTIRP
jgi:hypothetical protein